MKSTLVTRFVSLNVATISLLSLTIVGVSYYGASKAFRDSSSEDLTRCIEQVRNELSREEERTLHLAAGMAIRPDIIAAVESGNTAALQSIGKQVVDTLKISVLTFADKRGTVIARGHSDKAGDSVTNQLRNRATINSDCGLGRWYSSRRGEPGARGG